MKSLQDPRIRLLIDLAMATVLVAAFAYPFTSNGFHEVNGVIFGGLVVVHTAVNARWYFAIFKGRYSLFRALSTVINPALLLAILVTLAVAVPISTSVFGFLGFSGGAFLSQVHIAAANWVFVLASFHLGIYWDRATGMARRAMGKVGPLKGRYRVARVFSAAIAAYGIRAALHRNIGPKLVMYYSFDPARAGDAVPLLVLDYLAIMGLCVWVAHRIVRLVPPPPTER